jgi:PAS domain S-box-containing protein
MSDHASTLRAGLELAKVGRYEEGADKFMAAIEEAPDDPRGWFGLGLCCARAGRHDEAREALTEAGRLGHPKAQEVLDRLVGAGAVQHPASAAQAAQRVEAPGPVVGTPQPAEAHKAAPPEAARRRIDLGKRVRVMLVEDRPEDRKAISDALYGSLARAEVVESPFAESASRTIVGMGIFDIAIIDWDTSPQDARALLDFLKMKQPHIPVIVLTRAWSEEVAREIIQAGADYCLVKASGYSKVLPFVIEQRFKQSYALHEKIESDLGDVFKQARRRYLDVLKDAFVLMNREGRVIDLNRAASDLLRVNRERWIGEPCERLFAHGPEAVGFFPLSEVFESGETVTVERYDLNRKRHFRVTTIPVQDGGHTEYLNILQDVTGRRPEPGQAAPPAAAGADMLRLAELAGELAFELDVAGRVTRTSTAFAERLGYGRDELVGMKLEDLLADVNGAVAGNALDRLVRGRESIAGQDVSLRGRDGRLVPGRITLMPELADDGETVVGMVGLLADVSDRRRIEQAMEILSGHQPLD